MKKLIPIFLVVFFCFACQQNETAKQYFEESPEIEVCKKLVEAYNSQDWASFKSLYSDTAKMWHNSHFRVDPGFTPNDFVEGSKTLVTSLEFFKFTDDRLYEMIVDNNGKKWVHFWGKWIGKVPGNKEEVKTMVHIDYQLINGKIVHEVGFWDNLPLDLAQKEVTIDTFNSHHLINLKTENSQNDFLTLVNELNLTLEKMGYGHIQYKVSKAQNSQDVKYSYILESIWPSKEVYDFVHNSADYKEITEKWGSKFNELIRDDIKARYIPLN